MRIFIKAAVAAAVTAAVTAAVSSTGASARSTTPVNATSYTVACASVTGKVTFSPPLKFTGGSGTETFRIKAKIRRCTAHPSAGGSPVTVKSASVSASIHTNTTACSGLVGFSSRSLTGSFAIKWKTTPKLTSGNTTMSVPSAVFSIPTSQSPLTFQVPGGTPATVSGSFSGGGSGTSLASIGTSATLGSTFNACGSKAGLKKMPLTHGVFELGAPPTSISLTPANESTSNTNPIEYHALANFGLGQVDVSSLASWSSTDTSVAGIADCESASPLEFPPVCVQPTGTTGPTTIRATWQGVTGSTGLTIADPLGITTSDPLPDATLGSPYGPVTISASGGVGSYTWSAPAIVPGLSINPSTGAISGTPTVAGQLGAEVRVTDSANPHQTATYTFGLAVDCTGFCISPSSLPEANEGDPYSTTLSSSGGTGAVTYAVTFGTLPSGLSLNAATGEISGTPDEHTIAQFIVTATDSSSPTPQTTSEFYELNI